MHGQPNIKLEVGLGGQLHAPAALHPGEETRYPFYRRLVRPQGRSERVQKISPPPGFDPWTVQPIASLYIHCAIPAHNYKGRALGQLLKLSSQQCTVLGFFKYMFKTAQIVGE